MLKKLSYDQVKPFNEFIATKDGKNVKGVWFEDEYQRYYPYGSLACHAIGFTVSGNVGQGGVEGYYSDELNGTDGREYGYLTQDMTLERTTKPPVNGYNIISTIDANAQSIVEKKTWIDLPMRYQPYNKGLYKNQCIYDGDRCKECIRISDGSKFR